MGAKAKVDAKLYAKIKKELKTPHDDEKVMKKYKLGQTTVRAIRRSNSYKMFRLKTSIRPKKITLNSSLSPQEQAQRAWNWFVILFIFSMVFCAYLFIKWLLNLIFRI